MATVSPTINTSIPGVPRVIWSGVVTGDTLNPFTLKQQYGLAGSIQSVGTFGGATVGLQVSNDGSNWATAKDIANTNVSMAAATTYQELSLSGAYIKPTVTGGSANSIDIIIVLRGSSVL